MVTNPKTGEVMKVSVNTIVIEEGKPAPKTPIKKKPTPVKKKPTPKIPIKKKSIDKVKIKTKPNTRSACHLAKPNPKNPLKSICYKTKKVTQHQYNKHRCKKYAPVSVL